MNLSKSLRIEYAERKLFMNTETKIREFLLGNINIVTFRQEYDTNNDINDFLQNIVDNRISSGFFLPLIM